MKIVGITGSSGAGKTTLCQVLKEEYQAEIIDADNIAKTLSQKGSMYLESIVKQFGEEIINTEGELKRKKLASIIYEDENKRNQLNQLTFVYVIDEIKKKINQLQNKRLIVIDAPLLYESNLNQVCDFVIGVIAKEEDKVKRICKRDKVSEEFAKKRLKIQIDNSFLKENADYLIYNDEDMEKLEAELKNIQELQ